MSQSIRPSELLRQIGMQPRYKGYAYIMQILEATYDDLGLLYSLSTDVYPEIMKRFDTTRNGIDRNVRFAIDKTWVNGNKEGIRRIFNMYDIDWIPTNIEFISIVTEIMNNGLCVIIDPA